jgi:maltooligosyltrehalose trehalohydrolase
METNMINLSEVGAFPTAPTPSGVNVHFGIYLPGISPADGYSVVARVIHKVDRLTQNILPQNFPLNYIAGPYDLWAFDALIQPQSGTSFGLPGTYLYRYQLWQNNVVMIDWFTDPFARSTDEVGQFAAFTTPDVVTPFTWTDQNWKVPALDDLIVYELQVEEFNRTFAGIIERLPYLQSLGINCLELMPVTSLKRDFDWGYGPLHYFSPNERWGGIQGLKQLINTCHANGIAIILDVVYQHVDDSFPYQLVYENVHVPSPMIGGSGQFGPTIDYTRAFAREYIQSANFYWLDEYHIDGFRYDEVTDLYPDLATGGPTGVGYAQLVYNTYNHSLAIPRFTPSGQGNFGEYSRIIQCAEALGVARDVLAKTFTNCAWQEDLFNNATRLAPAQKVDDAFVNSLDSNFFGNPYPQTKQVIDRAGNPVDMPVAPFQYLGNHDKNQPIYFVQQEQPEQNCLSDIRYGDRSQFFRLQPFAIALYTSQGIPMLWQGQEFADNYSQPDCGTNLRIGLLREVHWEYFYDDKGVPLRRLYRNLGRLRRDNPALRGRNFFYYNQISRPNDGIVVYRRQQTNGNQIAYVFLNFSNTPQVLQFAFPETGIYREMIDNDSRPNPYEINIAVANQIVPVNVPSHYGYIFIKL